MFFRIISILLMQKQIPLCLLAIVLSVSLFGQNLKADKIILSDSDLTNLYQIDLRNRHRDDDEAKGTSIKLHRVKTKAHSISEKQLIQALRIIKNRKAPIVFHCHHGSDRTGAVCAFYRIIFQNVSKEDAIHEMTEGGYGFHRIYKNIIRRIKEANVEQIRKEVMEGGEL